MGSWPRSLRVLATGLLAFFVGWVAGIVINGWPSWPLMLLLGLIVVGLAWPFHPRFYAGLYISAAVMAGYLLRGHILGPSAERTAWNWVTIVAVVVVVWATIRLIRRVLYGKRQP